MFGFHSLICVSFIPNLRKVTLATLQGLERSDGGKKDQSCVQSLVLWREELDIFN